MKKNEIILARIISTASALALALLILTAGVGFSYFSKIAAAINDNTIAAGENNIYNYYFYMGLDTVYRLLFAVTVLSLTISILAVLFKMKNCGKLCNVSALSSFVTGLFLIFAGIFEKSKGLHRFIVSFYMGDVSGIKWVAGGFLPKFPIWAVLLLIVSALLFCLVRVTKFDKIKLYMNATDHDGLKLFLGGLYGCVFLETIRHAIMWNVVSGMDEAQITAYGYVNEYFVSESWLLTIPFVVYICMVVVLLVVTDERVNKRLHVIITVLLPALCVGIIGVYYILNPARIFGRLTLDEHVCDITEAAMTWYVLGMMAAVIFLTLLLYKIYMSMSFKKVIEIMALNFVLSIVLMIIGKMIFGLWGIYAGCVVADLICTAASYSLTSLKADISDDAIKE